MDHRPTQQRRRPHLATESAASPSSGETTVPLSSEHAEAQRSRWVLDFVFPNTLRVPIDRGECVLGRDEPWPWRLPSQAVSRRHARIEVRGSVVSIIDEQSRDGVHVNGRQHARTRLFAFDVVRLGDHVGIVRELAEGEHTEFCQLVSGLWGRETLRRAAATALTAAPSDGPVLVLGETGTGKELIARAIHDQSRRLGRWVTVNCSALNENLLEAELFGHVKGAFTGAETKRAGLVRSADGGTLFLDELGELPLAAQAKLLRVVQAGEVLSVGAEEPSQVNVRFIAATHRNLEELVRQGAFREDLYYRLSGLRVSLPALRQRREDVVPLFSSFVAAKLGRLPELAPLLVEALCLHTWPGNVRELRQVAEAMAVLHAELPRWRRTQLPEEMLTALSRAERDPVTPVPPRDLQERAVRAALREHAGNVSRAAKALGVARQSLYDLVQKYGIDAGEYRAK